MKIRQACKLDKIQNNYDGTDKDMIHRKHTRIKGWKTMIKELRRVLKRGFAPV